MDNTQTSSSTTASDSTKPHRSVSSKNSDLSQASIEGNDKPVKKLPPIKAPVGLAKSPDLKNCKSKIGSLNNIKHTPAGGKVIIQTQKLHWNAKSKVGSLENKEHKPAGGNVKVETRKLEWKTTPKVQSLQNVKHKPGGGNIKIFDGSYRERDKSISRLQSTSNKTNNGADDSGANNNPKSNQTSSKGTFKSSSATESLAKDIKWMSLKDK